MCTDSLFRINIRDILRAKMPELYRKLPDWTITLLSQLICQKQLNDYLHRNAELTGVHFMDSIIRFFNINLQLHGLENLPEVDRRCIFVSNHPLGGLDGICLSSVLGERYDSRIRYLVNDILWSIRPLRNIFIPINKYGVQGREAVQLLNEELASDNQIITFPAGLCSRKIGGTVRDLQWKKMFVTKSIEYQRDVIPIWFEARNSNLFYTIATIRKWFGLKTNIEMLLLPREMFRQQGVSFSIYFRKLVSWRTFDSSKTPQEWADKVQMDNMLWKR